MIKKIKFARDFIRAVADGISDDIKFNKMTFLQAVAEVHYMMFHVMGVDLYVKYKNGTAIEGVDFFVN